MGWLELDGKVAIVTGGAAGIGGACSEGLAEAGARVVVADIDEEGAKSVAEGLRKGLGGDHVAVRVDVTEKSSVDAMIAATIEAFGGIDVLVNNAGILIPRLLVDPAGNEELTEAILDRMLDINVKGFFLCAQAVARQMIASGSGGVIVNMSSESGLEGSRGQSVYAATKAAGYSVTRSWAKELGRHGIRVVGVAPGVLEATQLRSEEYERAVAYTRGQTVEAFRSGYEKASIPLGRVGTLKEVADVVCFLASPRAGYVHGTTINITGGKSRG